MHNSSSFSYLYIVAVGGLTIVINVLISLMHISQNLM